MGIEQKPILRNTTLENSPYLGFAMSQMRKLKSYMKIARLNVYSSSLPLSNGVVINCQVCFNREDIFIDVPKSVISEATHEIKKLYHYIVIDPTDYSDNSNILTFVANDDLNAWKQEDKPIVPRGYDSWWGHYDGSQPTRFISWGKQQISYTRYSEENSIISTGASIYLDGIEYIIDNNNKSYDIYSAAIEIVSDAVDENNNGEYIVAITHCIDDDLYYFARKHLIPDSTFSLTQVDMGWNVGAPAFNGSGTKFCCLYYSDIYEYTWDENGILSSLVKFTSETVWNPYTGTNVYTKTVHGDPTPGVEGYWFENLIVIGIEGFNGGQYIGCGYSGDTLETISYSNSFNYSSNDYAIWTRFYNGGDPTPYYDVDETVASERSETHSIDIGSFGSYSSTNNYTINEHYTRHGTDPQVVTSQKAETIESIAINYVNFLNHVLILNRRKDSESLSDYSNSNYDTIYYEDAGVQQTYNVHEFDLMHLLYDINNSEITVGSDSLIADNLSITPSIQSDYPVDARPLCIAGLNLGLQVVNIGFSQTLLGSPAYLSRNIISVLGVGIKEIYGTPLNNLSTLIGRVV